MSCPVCSRVSRVRTRGWPKNDEYRLFFIYVLTWSTSKSYPSPSIRRDKWCRSGGICLPHRVIGDVGSSYRSRVVHRRTNVDALLKLCWRSDTNAFWCCSNDNMTWHSLLGNSIASEKQVLITILVDFSKITIFFKIHFVPLTLLE